MALQLLRAVDQDGAYANLALPGLLTEYGLEGRDAGFATELAFGTLRLQGRYDAIIRECTDRPTTEQAPVVLDVLRLGAHQILAMDVPDYAAVSATVTLARAVLRPGQAGMVNAVLRRIAERTWPQWAEVLKPTAVDDPIGHWAVTESHPPWIVRALQNALAAQGAAAELPALLRTDNQAAPVTLVARPGLIDRDVLVAQSGGVPGRFSPWSVRGPGRPGAVPAVRSGAAGVQDEGSQLMVLALSRAQVGGSDREWLDMCAGPGGKTAVWAGLAAAAGARITAVEQHPHRADLVRKAVVGHEDVVDVVTGDAREAGLGYSRVLLDAPCTGLGAIRRRPDLRWRRTDADVPVLRAQQTQLLKAAVDSVAVGGVIAYVTCSPHLAETDDIVAALMRRDERVVQIDARALLPEVTDPGPGPAVRLWPHRHDTDGMYLAVLRRQA